MLFFSNISLEIIVSFSSVLKIYSGVTLNNLASLIRLSQLTLRLTISIYENGKQKTPNLFTIISL